MDYVVDVQGFNQFNESFILKKFAMITVDGNTDEETEFVVKSPLLFKKSSKENQIMNSWLTRNFHGIKWYSGTMRYPEAKLRIRIVLLNARVIYVWGFEKKKWLMGVLGRSVAVIDLKEQNCLFHVAIEAIV
ncbi:GfV-D6-ORF1 [Ichnoviriform fumiferanae]|uniref:GfV-D6-ORF1 n=1 Tax=Ichnoviriform fumiferanae TaxID=419435 RepID=A2PZZ9_9VIRU|nr:GfV-D6-ORF1 [Ichnoviriform fumiferanae]BAF45571.1 GfV-D6-ORF1 [Ichnoviriform fumiferanae]